MDKPVVKGPVFNTVSSGIVKVFVTGSLKVTCIEPNVQIEKKG